MEVSATENDKLNQAVTGNSTDTISTQDTAQSSSAFDALLTKIIAPSGQGEVNEEELFAGLIQERIVKLKGNEAGDSYANKLASTKASNGSLEEAARGALKELIADGTLTGDEASIIHAQAFKAAQLDDNADTLFDSRGGPNDPTIAVAQLEAALLSARTMVEKFDSGEEAAGTLGLDVGNTGLPNIRVSILADGTMSVDQTDLLDITAESSPEDGPEGFLFKPTSESDGNLVVLLPSKFKEQVESLLLKDSEDNEIEQGRSTAYANGDREHFRFSKAGSDYSENLKVEVKFKDGTSTTYTIADPSQRYD